MYNAISKAELEELSRLQVVFTIKTLNSVEKNSGLL
ncbi:hypothetical protein AGR7A_Lc50013 [Agrobacterium deltaense NCPPB 1641]|uniref:Uncharacterized protein n=1 Tax=Agrobacterium deltaense NCPPB 1641 TaxID=1183425 RepID=A0A1S7U588_9HYPH|nr:hypothetical protein AGR7A_Lc50013 [Agrobacterium deltaense NCPPB 1641]